MSVVLSLQNVFLSEGICMTRMSKQLLKEGKKVDEGKFEMTFKSVKKGKGGLLV